MSKSLLFGAKSKPVPEKEWIQAHQQEAEQRVEREAAQEAKANHLSQGGSVSINNGIHVWRDSDGLLHREDGPAVDNARVFVTSDVLRVSSTFLEDAEEWWRHGELHRVGGPAVVTSALKLWYQDNLIHREDGPAAEYANGAYEWYLQGHLHRPYKDGPAKSDKSGFEYREHGLLHRLDGPALMSPWYTKYYRRGVLHNLNGPAMIPSALTKKPEEYWINGTLFSKEEHTEEVKRLFRIQARNKAS